MHCQHVGDDREGGASALTQGLKKVLAQDCSSGTMQSCSGWDWWCAIVQVLSAVHLQQVLPLFVAVCDVQWLCV